MTRPKPSEHRGSGSAGPSVSPPSRAGGAGASGGAISTNEPWSHAQSGRLLMRIFSLGLASAAADDLEDILIAARLLRMDEMQVQLGEVRLMIRQENWLGAVRLLKQMEAQQQKDQVVTSALLGGCLFKLNDAEWCSYGSAMLRDGKYDATLSLLAGFLPSAEMLGDSRGTIHSALRLVNFRRNGRR